MMARVNAPDAPATRITLRDMTRADIRTVRRIESAAYQDAWPARAFDAELANAFARYRVAVEAPIDAPAQPARGTLAMLRRLAGRAEPQRIVGFMGVWYMQDQMHLVTIATDPAHWSRGIGARLLLDCLDLAREAELPEVVLEVRVGNVRARLLYERMGFHQVGRLIAYYKDNDEDAFVMLSGQLNDAAAIERHTAIRDELRARGIFADIDRAPSSSETGSS